MKEILEVDSIPKFSTQLPADPIEGNFTREVKGACFSFVETKKPSNPELLHVSQELLNELGLAIGNIDAFTEVMSGLSKFPEFKPFAMCYGGHQFGNWAGQLGDGRAINIAEIQLDKEHLTLQLKGAGPTPYSRRADGLAVLRSSIREYLCSEAMHHLGVPTTRALSLVKSGDMVPRDIMYSGDVQDEQGAIVCRVAPSFIRFGNFEIFTSRNEIDELRQLVDFTIKHYYPDLGKPSKEVYLEFVKRVSERTRDMIVDWQRVGFVHGVMNTDNLSILGLTIDYGPYGWLEDYDPDWTPNTTDAQHRRYRFGNQPDVGLWNLAQLARAIYPLIEDTDALQAILEDYKVTIAEKYHQMMCSKLGLTEKLTVPQSFIIRLAEQMNSSQLDMTIFFRELSSHEVNDFEDFKQILLMSSYLMISEDTDWSVWMEWYFEYSEYVSQDDQVKDVRFANMKGINPKYVLRNYMAQLAIDDAEKGDYKLLNELYDILSNPYKEQPDKQKWYAKRPDWAKEKVGCSMLSCSS